MPPKVFAIDPSEYQKSDLTGFKDDYFPVILTIETKYPADYNGRAKKSVQFTYGFFSLSEGNMGFRFVKQKFLVSSLTAVQQQDLQRERHLRRGQHGCQHLR